MISLMQLISKFKASEVQFAVTAQQIQNVLNENLSQSGSGLAQIGTEWGSGERRSRTEQLSQFHHRIDRRPPFNVWSILMISEVWYVLFEFISWHDSTMCRKSWHQIPRKIFHYLDSDSVRVSSQVLIMCHDNTIIPNVCENTHNIIFHVSRNKAQDMHTRAQT